MKADRTKYAPKEWVEALRKELEAFIDNATYSDSIEVEAIALLDDVAERIYDSTEPLPWCDDISNEHFITAAGPEGIFRLQLTTYSEFSSMWLCMDDITDPNPATIDNTGLGFLWCDGRQWLPTAPLVMRGGLLEEEMPHAT